MVTQETKNDTLAAGAEASKEVSATRVELDDLLQEAKKKGKEFTRAQKKEIRKFLENNPEFALTKEQRLVLVDELTGIEPEKLDKIKQYLYQRDLIRHLAGKAAGLHKQDVEATIKARLETISVTSDNLKNILTEIREKKVEGNNKYMLLYTTYTRFFAVGKF